MNLVRGCFLCTILFWYSFKHKAGLCFNGFLPLLFTLLLSYSGMKLLNARTSSIFFRIAVSETCLSIASNI